MSKRKKPAGTRPTEGELEILRVLWARGPSTVRDVHATLAGARGVGTTTVLKLMQIMTDKGLLARDESVRPQIYRPARPMQQTQRALLSDLVERVFDGSPGKLVLHALSTRRTSAEELQEIRALLERLEEEAS